MKGFRVEAIAQTELEEATTWYEDQSPGLGIDFIAEVEAVLTRIAHQESFATVPIAAVPGGAVRREFVERFPYVVVFVETAKLMIRRGNSSPARWRSRL